MARRPAGKATPRKSPKPLFPPGTMSESDALRRAQAQAQGKYWKGVLSAQKDAKKMTITPKQKSVPIPKARTGKPQKGITISGFKGWKA